MILRKIFGFCVGMLFLLVMVPLPAYSEVPNQVNYQGYLTSNDGNPLDGIYSIVFAIYATDTGGSTLWTENQTVDVVDGKYSVQLGQSNPFSAGFFDGDLYLGVKVGSDPEMMPRLRITSVAFAMKAEDADTLQGFGVSDFVGAEQPNSINSSMIVNGSVGAADLGTDSVGSSHISANAVGSNEIANGSVTASDLQNGAALAEILDNDGPGSGLNADFLDGYDGSAYTRTTQDYGRSGVASNLYEGTQTLTGKYVNQSGDSMGHLYSETIEIGTGWSESIHGKLYSPTSGGYGAGIYGEATGEYAHGVHGGATGNSGSGVYGEVTGNSGKGIYGKSHSSSGWAGYFDGKVEINGSLTAGISEFNVGGGSIAVTTPGGWPGVIAYSPNGHRRDIQYYNDFMCITMSDSSDASPSTNGIRIYETGNVAVKVLQITGGSDLSEQFDIRGVKDGLEPSPGMVVSIDPEKPGNLMVTNTAYDKRVAGIISGAGGVKPGMLMGQKGSKADGSNPVALSGRVYCLADASNGAIGPGDLLTSSETPGHAMKVCNYGKAQGAILGKAMSKLEKDRGLVLVLVTLQ